MCVGAVGYKVDGKGLEEEGTDTTLVHLNFLMAERDAERVGIHRHTAADEE